MKKKSICKPDLSAPAGGIKIIPAMPRRIRVADISKANEIFYHPRKGFIKGR